jgi:ABC-type Fe3+ transport system permease subunit
MAYGLRLISSALLQVGPELEEAHVQSVHAVVR